MIQSHLDISSPPDVAWELAQRWSTGELVLVDDAGHGAGHPSTYEAVLTATQRFGRSRT
jgi:proline iminopeptidase